MTKEMITDGYLKILCAMTGMKENRDISKLMESIISETPEEFNIKMENLINSLSSSVSERDFIMFKMYFGIGCDSIPNYAKIGKMFNVTEFRTREIIRRVLKFLRLPERRDMIIDVQKLFWE